MTTSPRRPTPAARATRRSRRQAPRNQSFLERNRPKLLWGVAGLVFVLLVGMAYLSFTRPTYACTNVFDPTPAPAWVAPSPAPVASGATAAPAVTPPPPGYVQPDTGRAHVEPGTTITYRNCPPAGGRHYNAAGQGPIPGRLYGPGDQAIPPGWVHNLEHGAIVLLYSCKAPEGQVASACSDEGQQQLEDLLARWPDSPICKIPKGQLTPVIARFDDMPSAYTAIVWSVVLPMDQLDESLLFDFYARQGELNHPEKQCPDPTPTPGPATPTPAPAATPAASTNPSPAGSPGPASTGTAAPAATTAP